MSCRILRKSLFFYSPTTNLFEIFCGFERVHGIFADCSSSGSCGLPVVWQPPVVLHGAAQHLGPEKTWPPGVSPVSRQQIMQWRRRKKYGEIKSNSQMLHCRLMLIIRVQGQEKTPNNAHCSRCVEEATPMGLRWTTERNNSSSYERCRLCLHYVWAKGSLWMSN